jgi:hypothetical protein
MLKCLVLLSTVALLSVAQPFPKNSVELGGGAGIPLFARSQMFWDSSAQLSVGYGLRFVRRLQADLMYTHVFNPAAAQFEQFSVLVGHTPGGGSIDSILLGGRVVFPLRKRVLVSVGAGSIYDRFTAPQLNLSVNGDACGWGVYLLGSASMPLGRSNHFYLAITPRVEVVQARDAWLHRNRWLTLPVQLGFRF